MQCALQEAAAAQRIGKLFGVIENYRILQNFSQPFKQVDWLNRLNSSLQIWHWYYVL